jgi:hypothetical protein
MPSSLCNRLPRVLGSALAGIGFRERSEASDFNAALHEFLQVAARLRCAALACTLTANTHVGTSAWTTG